MRHFKKALGKTGGLYLLVALLACAGINTSEAAEYAPLPNAKPSASIAVSAIQQVPVPNRKPDSQKATPIQPASSLAASPYPRQKPLAKKGPMSKADIALHKKIFALQAEGKWNEADQLISRLTDKRLRGHILYQRYMHPTAYKSSFEELAGWLNLYNDHPGADRVFNLSLARKPSNFVGKIRKPQNRQGVNGYLEILLDQNKPYRPEKRRTAPENQAVTSLNQEIKSAVSRGNPAKANKLLSDKRASYLDHAEFDNLRAYIARSYMQGGDIKKAYRLAESSAKRSGKKTPLAGWIAGLTAWRLGKYQNAAQFFEITATSPYSSSWTASAGAYWASRSHMRAGHVSEVNIWLKQAAFYPRTFYGLLATRSLGWDFDFNWVMPALTNAHMKDILTLPAGYRAVSLVDIGQYHLAELELRRINPKRNKKLTEALFAYAHSNDLPSFAMRLAEAKQAPDGSLFDAALYPLSPWKPKEGYRVDRALIHALIRQESRFDPYAESHSGAAGLMQLMPETASYVAGDSHYRKPAGRHSLKDPRISLDLGQLYIETLMDRSEVNNELFSLAIAYNAGPGNLRKWKKQYSDIDDPLLFIETIPMAETRGFVERVMANYWIYRMRLGQPTPSLNDVVEGRWAGYVSMDNAKETSLTGKSVKIAKQ